MIRPIPDAPARILRSGVLCYLASRHPSGPHVTPVVYAMHGSRLWITTSRRSVKARSWRADATVGGLIRSGDRAVVFAGRVTTYDLLEPGTWPRSVAHAPSLTRAATTFTAKNARFFAGYAVDAYRVPLAWTPPGRVFASVELDRLAVIRGARVHGTWGRLGVRLESHGSFRATRSGGDPFAGVPTEVAARVLDVADAVLGIDRAGVPVAVLPCGWTIDRGALYAALPAEILRLAGPAKDVRASITVDHASQWRARAMTGVLAQGAAEIFEIRRLSSGKRSAAAIAERAGIDPGTAAVVRLRPRRLVWWSGWDSGSVAAT